MNYLVFLNAQAGELEKILSGTKSMVVKEFDPTRASGQPVRPGDSLYFLRNKDESTIRVKATVVRVLFYTDRIDDDLSHVLKEMQPGLQLTEEQYTTWSEKQKILLVEFEAAHKIDAIHVASNKLTDWIAFEEFDLIM